MTRRRRPSDQEGDGEPNSASGLAPGKRSRTSHTSGAASSIASSQLSDPLPPWDGPTFDGNDDPFGLHLETPVQRRGGSALGDEETRAVAQTGIGSADADLPHRDAIQRSLGPEHDLGRVRAHVGGAAESSAHAMGAEAFATGDHVALPGNPSLGLVAHEVAHTIQQRAGVHLSGGVGSAGDPYEQQADAVADGVERGQFVGHLLPTDNASGAAVVQRRGPGGGPPVAPPTGDGQDELIRFLTSLRPELVLVTPRPLIVPEVGGTTASVSLVAPFLLPINAPPTTVVARVLDAKGKDVWQAAGAWRKGQSFADTIPLNVPGKGTFGLRVRIKVGDVAERDVETSITAQAPSVDRLPQQSDVELGRQHRDLQSQLATEDDPKQRARLQKAYQRTEWEASQRGLDVAANPDAPTVGLPTDPAGMRAFLEHQIATKGWRGRRTYLSGAAYNTEVSAQQIELGNQQLAIIEAEMSAFRSSFESSTYSTADSMLRESIATMTAVASSYGAATGAGLELAAEKIRRNPDALDGEVDALVRGMKSRSDVSKSTREHQGENRDDLRRVVGSLIERQREVEHIVSQQDRLLARSHQHQPHHARREGARIDFDDADHAKSIERIDRVRKGRGEGPLLHVAPAREHLTIDQISVHLHHAQRVLEADWAQAEASHPFLMAYRDGMASSKTLTGLEGNDDAMQREMLRTILPRFANAGKAAAMIRGGKPHPASLGPVVALTKQRLLVAPGSMREAVVNDLEDAHDGSTENWIVLAIVMALAAISFVPTGGTSSALVVGAELGGLALDAYLAVKASVEYDQSKILGNTDLTVAHSLAGEEPSLTWLAFNLVTMGVSAAVVRSVWREAVTLRRNAEAGRASQQAIRELNELGKSHNLGEIGTRIADEPVGDAAQAAGLARTGASSATRRQAHHLGGLAADNVDGLAVRLGAGVEVDKGLRHGQIDIDFDPAGGHVWVIGLRVAPDATVDDVLAHAKALEQMQRYNGRLGDLRRSIDRAKGAGKAATTAGTAEWRARIEIEKLADEIRSRQAALRKVSPAQIGARLEAEIAVLDAKMAEYQTVLHSGGRESRVSERIVGSPALGPADAAKEGRGLPGFAVKKADVVEKLTEESKKLFELELVVTGPDQKEWRLMIGSVDLDDTGAAKGFPNFTLESTMLINKKEHAAEIFDDVVIEAGKPPTGVGQRTPLTRYAIARFEAHYARRFGHPPTALEGRLAWENKLNFQREYFLARTRDQLSAYEAGQQAIQKISFGKHRIAAGYDQFVVNMKGVDTVDLGGSMGSQQVPKTIDVVAFRKGGVP